MLNDVPVIDPANQRLANVLAEVEEYVGQSGWDQPARLFALVDTTQLKASSPELAEQLKEVDDGRLSAIEQDDFHSGEDLITELSKIGWSEEVAGVALSLERCFLPPQMEAEIPQDPAAAAEFVANHPEREEIRLVIGVLRDGVYYSLARLKTKPDQVASGTGLVPVLEQALAQTLHE